MLSALLEMVLLSLLEVIGSLISLAVDVVRATLFSRPPTSEEIQHRLHERNRRKRARLVRRGGRTFQKRRRK